MIAYFCHFRLPQLKVLDIKFLFDLPNPTIAVLYKVSSFPFLIFLFILLFNVPESCLFEILVSVL